LELLKDYSNRKKRVVLNLLLGVFLLTGIVLVGYVVQGYRTGVVVAWGGEDCDLVIYRSEKPGAFWCEIFFESVAGLAMILWPILQFLSD